MNLSDGSARMVTDGLPAYGVALDGHGKAYVGQKDGGEHLYEVDVDARTKREVAALLGANTPRATLDGAGKAYVADPAGGRLYEIGLADGAQRVVVTGLGTAPGVKLDSGNGHIYVSNQAGQLWRISQAATRSIGTVNVVA